MKHSDIQKIYDEGLISEDQFRRIIEHYGLARRPNVFLPILVGIGGVLLLFGIILVISANWEQIPRLVKIVCGALLLAGAHTGGHWLCEHERPKTGQVLHFLGAGLFLANIALIGQVYNLSSRMPNALLFWLAGIIPLAWILRSRLIHALSLVGLFFWFGSEINANDGWLHFADDESQMLLYAALGALFYGSGLYLCKTSFAPLGRLTQYFGLPTLHIALWFALCNFSHSEKVAQPVLFFSVATILAAIGLWLLGRYFRGSQSISGSWALAWGSVIAGWVAALGFWAWFGLPHYWGYRSFNPWSLGFCVLIVAGSLIQIRTAVELRSVWMINFGVLSIGVAIIIEFFQLFGSMMDTGLIFLVGGLGLLALGYVLERRRRVLMQQIKA